MGFKTFTRDRQIVFLVPGKRAVEIELREGHVRALRWIVGTWKQRFVVHQSVCDSVPADCYGVMKTGVVRDGDV